MPIKLLKNIKFKKERSNYCFVTCKHVTEAYVFTGVDLNTPQPLFNDGYPTLIFMPSKMDRVRLRQGEREIWLESIWVSWGPIEDTHWAGSGTFEYMIALRFNPASFFPMFKIDPQDFKNQPVRNANELFDDYWLDVFEQMYRLNSLDDRLTLLSRCISAHKLESDLPFLLRSAVAFIERSRGNMSVNELVDQFGGQVNHKWLYRNFTRYLGMSPKKYISLQRFIYTFGQYETDPAEGLFGIALSGGYYDYNHFSKDFKRYIGVTPSKYNWS